MDGLHELWVAIGEFPGSTTVYTWLGIAICITQAGMFSGLNLAVFSISRLRLEVEAAGGNRDALRVLDLRRDSNHMLATILWGNVGVNVLLTLLSDSVLTGVGAFVFSTVVITLFGEIFPQAYFSRKALRVAAVLTPMLKFYRVLLYPVAKSTALLLDWWLGREAIVLFRERDFPALIAKHVESAGSDVGHVEGLGALNFLDLDDVRVLEEGEAIDPRSIITLAFDKGHAVLPQFERSPHDPFLRRVNASGKKWVIITDPCGEPRLVLDAHRFLRDMLFETASVTPEAHWHRPITVRDTDARLGELLALMQVKPEHSEDDVIDHDLILVWAHERRIITGADLLGRLLRGIAGRASTPHAARPALG